MLKLDDRLMVAMGNGMGVNLTPDEVTLVAGWLVTLRQIADSRSSEGVNRAASRALGPLK